MTLFWIVIVIGGLSSEPRLEAIVAEADAQSCRAFAKDMNDTYAREKTDSKAFCSTVMGPVQ